MRFQDGILGPVDGSHHGIHTRIYSPLVVSALLTDRMGSMTQHRMHEPICGVQIMRVGGTGMDVNQKMAIRGGQTLHRAGP